jgi:hypothetical protein
MTKMLFLLISECVTPRIYMYTCKGMCVNKLPVSAHGHRLFQYRGGYPDEVGQADKMFARTEGIQRREVNGIWYGLVLLLGVYKEGQIACHPRD